MKRFILIAGLLFLSTFVIADGFYFNFRRRASAGGGAPGVQSSGTTNTLDTTDTMSLTVTTAGSDRLLFVGTGTGDASPALCGVASMTYNGVSLTQSWAINSSDWVRSEGWYLVAPTIGANTLLVVFTNINIDQRGLIWACVTNVHQTVPVDTAATAAGVSTTISVGVTSVANDLVLSMAATDAENSITITTGTEVQKVQNIGSDLDVGMASGAGAATVTQAWTINSEDWAIGGVSINPP